MKKKTLVICDDDKIDIKLFKKYLGPEKIKNYEILEINSGDELNELLKSKKYHIDLLLLDYYLGDTTGLDLLRSLNKEHNFPVIILTGRGDEEIAVECMKEGASDYIAKYLISNYDLEKTINQAIERWEVEQERDHLLGIAAHELRNPLSVILGYTEILQDYDEVDYVKQKEMINVIHERSRHLLNIINELLDITRIDKGIVSLKKRVYNLQTLVRKKVDEYKFQAEKKKIKIDFASDLEELLIEIDPDRLEEVLSNFIDNAIKYSPENTSILISLRKNDDKAEIIVKDEGLGIKENELKYLFKLFSSKKISTLPTGKETRTGLGLAICKKVIDAHGGEIFVQSQTGQGSVFTIVLPINLNVGTD